MISTLKPEFPLHSDPSVTLVKLREHLLADIGLTKEQEGHPEEHEEINFWR